MGCNYYARLIPTNKRKDELKRLIDSDDWYSIKEEVQKTFSKFEPYTMDEPLEGYIHLCKHSAGWKTLWNPNIYQIRNGHSEFYDNPDGSRGCRFIEEPDTARYIYPLTKKGIKALIDREDIEIYDEYGEKQDKEEFWKDSLTRDKGWRGEKPWDGAAYEKEHSMERHYSCRNNYTIFLESLGYKPTSSTWSDFYSDGLRFASTTDFG